MTLVSSTAPLYTQTKGKSIHGPIHSLLLKTHTQTQSGLDMMIFLPGHNRVSSLREPTMSRDDSIVVALPSNILPKKDNKIKHYNKDLTEKLTVRFKRPH